MDNNSTSSTVRWYHQIDGTEAERLLTTFGQDGSFLARPSTTTSGGYTLTVRRNDRITHVKIQSNGEFYDLYGGEKFATLSELVEHYMKRRSQLKEVNGNEIELKYPFLEGGSLDTSHLSTAWFHKHITGQVAEKMLREKGKLGSFLVRSSLQKPNSYVLCVLVDTQACTQVLHIRIFYDEKNKLYDIGGGQSFDSLNDLIEHYKKTPMVDKSGTVVYLKQPFNATRVPAAHIGSRVQELELGQGKTGFWEEFEELQSESETNKLSRDEGLRPENKAKNRFKNILPFDDSRVCLTKDNPPCSTDDYINANYIKDSSHPTRRYIATQGPLNNTEGDFWRMVWQEEARVIVMTTKEVERGKNKCVRYWPSKNEPVKEVPVHNGKFLLRHLEENRFHDQYAITQLEIVRFDAKLKQMGPTRRVIHYQYLGWPDHNVPADPSGILNLLRRVHEDDDGQHPLIVHCSAGIGRTGSVIIIDMLLGTIRAAGLECDIDVKRTTANVRQQRSGMVQTESQYKFIYKAIHYFIDIENKRIKAEEHLGTGHDYTNLTSYPEDVDASRGPQIPPRPSKAMVMS